MNEQIFNQSTEPLATAPIISTVIYAGFWRRVAAVIIDCICLCILTLFSYFLFKDPFTNFFFGVVVNILYYAVFDSSALMGTPGKALMGIAIVNEENHRQITFKIAAIRVLLKYISMVILFIGVLMQLFTKKRQTLHDMLTEVVVIKKDVGDMNYFKAYKENFKKIID